MKPLTLNPKPEGLNYPGFMMPGLTTALCAEPVIDASGSEFPALWVLEFGFGFWILGFISGLGFRVLEFTYPKP